MQDWKEAAKKNKVKHSEIISWFFEPAETAEPNRFICKSCREVYKCANCDVSGYSNLFTHLERAHAAYQQIILDTLHNKNSSPIDYSAMNSLSTKKGKIAFILINHWFIQC